MKDVCVASQCTVAVCSKCCYIWKHVKMIPHLIRWFTFNLSYEVSLVFEINPFVKRFHNWVTISHVESVKAVKSCLYCNALGISWVSCLWVFRVSTGERPLTFGGDLQLI